MLNDWVESGGKGGQNDSKVSVLSEQESKLLFAEMGKAMGGAGLVRAHVSGSVWDLLNLRHSLGIQVGVE